MRSPCVCLSPSGLFHWTRRPPAPPHRHGGNTSCFHGRALFLCVVRPPLPTTRDRVHDRVSVVVRGELPGPCSDQRGSHGWAQTSSPSAWGPPPGPPGYSNGRPSRPCLCLSPLREAALGPVSPPRSHLLPGSSHPPAVTRSLRGTWPSSTALLRHPQRAPCPVPLGTSSCSKVVWASSSVVPGQAPVCTPHPCCLRGCAAQAAAQVQVGRRWGGLRA